MHALRRIHESLAGRHLPCACRCSQFQYHQLLFEQAKSWIHYKALLFDFQGEASAPLMSERLSARGGHLSSSVAQQSNPLSRHGLAVRDELR